MIKPVDEEGISDYKKSKHVICARTLSSFIFLFFLFLFYIFFFSNIRSYLPNIIIRLADHSRRIMAKRQNYWKLRICIYKNGANEHSLTMNLSHLRTTSPHVFREEQRASVRNIFHSSYFFFFFFLFNFVDRKIFFIYFFLFWLMLFPQFKLNPTISGVAFARACPGLSKETRSIPPLNHQL